MTALLWAALGILLLVVEMMTGTFVILFFGVSALVVALAKWLGLDNWTIEVITFAVVGMLMLLIFRKKLKASFSPASGFKHEQSLRLTALLPASGEATIEYQGSLWTVANTTNEEIPAGAVVEVVKTEGVKLFVKLIS